MYGSGGLRPPAVEVDHQVQLHRPPSALRQENPQTGTTLHSTLNMLLSLFCLFPAVPQFALCWSWSGSDLIFIPSSRFCRVWITCTRNARLSTRTLNQKTSSCEWTRFTFRNWQLTPNCGSCRCPPPSPAPQVSAGDRQNTTHAAKSE